MSARDTSHTGALVAGLVLALVVAPPRGVRAQEPAIAIVGATIIDGNGGVPLRDATIVVRGKRIAALGPRSSVPIPSDARTIDGSGKFLTPGFIDTNVHVSMMSGTESYARYWDRHEQ